MSARLPVWVVSTAWFSEWYSHSLSISRNTGKAMRRRWGGSDETSEAEDSEGLAVATIGSISGQLRLVGGLVRAVPKKLKLIVESFMATIDFVHYFV